LKRKEKGNNEPLPATGGLAPAGYGEYWSNSQYNTNSIALCFYGFVVVGSSTQNTFVKLEGYEKNTGNLCVRCVLDE